MKCELCGEEYEVITLKIACNFSSPCPHCKGEGILLISVPSIVYEVFNERATHKLPDWNQKMAQAKAHDAWVRRNPRLAPLEHDKGQNIKVYESDFGHQERKALASKAQLDNTL